MNYGANHTNDHTVSCTSKLKSHSCSNQSVRCFKVGGKTWAWFEPGGAIENTNEKKTAILIDTPLINPFQRKRTRPLKLKPYKKIKTPSSETIDTTQTSISQPTHTPQTSTKSTPESINKPHSSTSHRAEMEERRRRAFLIFNKKT